MPQCNAILSAGVALFAMTSAPPTHADPPAMHTVKYVVYGDVPTPADIYYRDADPSTFADYSHDPYQYSPKVEADIAPGAQWELEAALTDPDRWAMVVVSSALSTQKPGFRCDLMVDGVVRVINDGRKGALCSLRHW